MTKMFTLLAAVAVLVATAPATATATESTDRGRMMLLLDSSGSMKETAAGGVTKIQAARTALGKVVDSLPADQPVGMRVFGATVFSRSDTGACTDTQRVVDLGEDNRDELKAAVKKYKPYGETPIGNALTAAGQDLGGEGRRTIVLVSDGEATCAPDPCKVAAKLSDQGISLSIDVVGLDVSGKAREQLRCIADKGNGSYYDVRSAGELSSALATVAQRAAKPYAAIGTPIKGGADASHATTIKSGDWKDTLTAQGTTTGERWYAFHRTIAKSTIHVTATIKNVGAKDSLYTKAFSGTTDCGYGQESAPASYRPFLAASMAIPGPKGYEEACASGKDLTIQVARGLPSLKGYAKSNDAVIEIRIVEEPPATNSETLPKDQRDSAQPKPGLDNPVKIVGGNSFGDAVEIKPGAYSVTIVPGEAQLFEVDASWGQVVNAAVDFPPASAALGKELGHTGVQASLWIFSPARASASSAAYVKAQGPVTDDYSSALTSHTYPIGYANRQSFVESRSAASLAGKYYISVAVAQNPDHPTQAEIPFTMGVDVRGAVAGAPDYKGGKPEIGSTATTKQSAPAPTKGHSPLVPIGLGAAGIVLLAGAGVLVGRARAEAPARTGE